ncbi:MAG: hypothetical protein LLF76_13450 [Planctomycetaceae bacterium]|nr:hypothetical protein [Planctomycetaceae bacterium]
MRKLIVLLAAVLCVSCRSSVSVPEWKQQPLIFPTDPAMSKGFVSIEEEGQTITLTADFGKAEGVESAAGLKRIDIQRLPTVTIVSEGRQDMRIGPVDVKQAGTHLYAAFSARTEKPGRMLLAVYKGDRLCEGLLKVLEPQKEWRRYRFILRMHEPSDAITLRIQTDAAVEISEVGALCKVPR